MTKEKKLINILLILLIVYVLYLMSDLWLGVFLKIMSIINPFICGFALAYGLTPFLKWMQKKNIPKVVGIIIISVIILSLLAFIIINIVPVFTTELVDLLQGIIKFVNDLDSKISIDLSGVKESLVNTFNGITSDLPSKGFTILNASLTVFSNLIIAIVSFFYFLADMDRIRSKVKLFFKSRKKKTYELVSLMDKNMTSYFKGLFINILIMFIEYTILYKLIGHPNFLLLGLIAAFTPLIPYFGGVIMNIIAIITAAVISTKLMILSIVVMIIFPQIDGYLIVPKIYGKTNKIPPLLTVFTAFAGGVLGGVVGIIVALPVTIILLTVYRYYEKEITAKLNLKKAATKD